MRDPALDEEPLAVQLPSPVDSGEGTEGSEDRQVHPVNQDQDDQRNKDAHGAPDRDVMVLVAGGKSEHLGEQLHVGLRLSIRCQSHGGSVGVHPNPTPGDGRYWRQTGRAPARRNALRAGGLVLSIG
jgi:hypothetical protein